VLGGVKVGAVGTWFEDDEAIARIELNLACA
jgi:hypothetical protein